LQNFHLPGRAQALFADTKGRKTLKIHMGLPTIAIPMPLREMHSSIELVTLAKSIASGVPSCVRLHWEPILQVASDKISTFSDEISDLLVHWKESSKGFRNFVFPIKLTDLYTMFDKKIFQKLSSKNPKQY